MDALTSAGALPFLYLHMASSGMLARLQVEAFLLEARGEGIHEPHHRRQLMRWRNNWLRVLPENEDHADAIEPLLQMQNIRNPPVPDVPIGCQTAWALPYAYLLRGTLEAVQEVRQAGAKSDWHCARHLLNMNQL